MTARINPNAMISQYTLHNIHNMQYIQHKYTISQYTTHTQYNTIIFVLWMSWQATNIVHCRWFVSFKLWKWPSQQTCVCHSNCRCELSHFLLVLQKHQAHMQTNKQYYSLSFFFFFYINDDFLLLLGFILFFLFCLFLSLEIQTLCTVARNWDQNLSLWWHKPRSEQTNNKHQSEI